MVEFINETFYLPGWRSENTTYVANNSGWYEAYQELERMLGNLDNTLSAFGGAGFQSISGTVDRLFDGFAALSFCRENLEYELFVEIDQKLMKQFGEMTDEFATLDVRKIRTPNVLGIRGINVGYDAEGRAVSETVGGEVDCLTLENFTGAAGFENTSGYKEQCITGFSKMLENQYNFYVDEGVLDRNVKLWEYLDGMMPREFEYSQYTEVWKKTAHSFLDVLVVPTMVEAVTGVEFITGDHLTDNEQAGKAVQSLIQAVSIGMTAGGAYSKGLTYVAAGKMQSSQISTYAACKVMKSVAEDGVMNMVTTELTEHDCKLAARVLMFASMYVGMQEAPDLVDRYVENGGMVKSNSDVIPDVEDIRGIIKGEMDNVINVKNSESDIETRYIVNTNGLRNDLPLTQEQIDELISYAKDLGFPESKIYIADTVTSSNTGILYDEILLINNDVLPTKLPTNNPNSLVSGKGAIAHEIIGHYETALKGTSFNQYDMIDNQLIRNSFNTALDEAQASIRAARFAPGLNFEERAILIRDGLQRLEQEGLKINDVRHLLDIAER